MNNPPSWYYPPAGATGIIGSASMPSASFTGTTSGGCTIPTTSSGGLIPTMTTTSGGVTITPNTVGQPYGGITINPNSLGTYGGLMTGSGTWLGASYSPDWDTLLKGLNTGLAGMIPAGDHFIVLRGDYLVSAQGKARPLLDWLNDCKYIKYMKANNEVVILKAVWDSIFVYMKGDGPFADLELNEFLDRMFAPVEKKPDTCAVPQPG